MSRRYNLKLLQEHKTYTVQELASTLGVSVGTIRGIWRPAGLLPIDDRRPHLFHGAEARRFLAAREKPRQPMLPGQIYCVACRCPQWPLGGAVWLQPLTSETANLVGICPCSKHRIMRRVRLPELAEKLGPCRIISEDELVTIMSTGDAPRTALKNEMA